MDDVTIRVLIYKDHPAEPWLAQGLEHDILAQAETLEEVHRRFRMQVAAHFISEDETGFGLKDVGRAPQKFWDLYNHAKVSMTTDPEPFRTSSGKPLPRIDAQFRIIEPVLAAE